MSESQINYQQALKEFQAVVKPDKYNDAELEQIKQRILSKRGHVK